MSARAAAPVPGRRLARRLPVLLAALLAVLAWSLAASRVQPGTQAQAPRFNGVVA